MGHDYIHNNPYIHTIRRALESNGIRGRYRSSNETSDERYKVRTSRFSDDRIRITGVNIFPGFRKYVDKLSITFQTVEKGNQPKTCTINEIHFYGIGDINGQIDETDRLVGTDYDLEWTCTPSSPIGLTLEEALKRVKTIFKTRLEKKAHYFESAKKIGCDRYSLDQAYNIIDEFRKEANLANSQYQSDLVRMIFIRNLAHKAIEKLVHLRLGIIQKQKCATQYGDVAIEGINIVNELLHEYAKKQRTPHDILVDGAADLGGENVYASGGFLGGAIVILGTMSLIAGYALFTSEYLNPEPIQPLKRTDFEKRVNATLEKNCISSRHIRHTCKIKLN